MRAIILGLQGQRPRRTLFFQAAFASLLCFFSTAALSQVSHYTLANGLKVVVKEDHRAPVAVSILWYNVGSADEKKGKTGLSHALEHMMFKGTARYPQGVFSKTIADLGGQENAFTTTDYTAYYEALDTKHLAVGLELEADRMRNLLLKSSDFAKEIQVIREERRMRTDDNPQSLAYERLMATAYLASPYQHPVIGWMNDLKQMQIEDLRAWYQRYYAPNNATLVVVGDVKPEEVEALAKRYFGGIKPSTIPERKSQIEPRPLGKKIVNIRIPAKVPMLLMAYTVPSVNTTPELWQPYALELIAGILDAGDSARLAKNLIRRDHIANNVDVFYNLYSRYQSQFIIYGSPSAQHQLGQLRKAILKEIHRLQTEPVSKEELDRVKTQIIAQKTFEKDSMFSQAMELGLLETLGLGWQTGAAYTQRIKDVSPQQIQEAAKLYFQEDALTEGRLIPVSPNEKKA